MPDQYGTFGSYLADADIPGLIAQHRQRAALTAYAANPQDQATFGRLLSLDPGTAVQLGNLQLRQRVQAKAEADSAKTDAANGLIAGALGGATPTSLHATQAPTGQQGAAVAASMGQPDAQPTGGDIVVTGHAQQPVPTISDIIRVGGPDAGKTYLALREGMGKLDDQGRKALADKAESFASTIPALQSLPYAQRRDQIDANRGFFKAHGWTDQEIDSYDPSDANLSASLGQGIGAKAVLDQHDKDRSFAETVRAHSDENARAAASRAVSLRGQNMADSRAREANGIAQAQATNSAVVDYLADNFRTNGGQLPNLGFRSGPLRAAIIQRAQEKDAAEGKGGADLTAAAASFVGRKAGARAVGTIGAKADFGVNEMNAAAPLALSASAAVPRGNFVPFNKVQQIIARGGGSPELKDFAVKTQAMINAYNLTAARSGSSVGEREHNATLLATADSPAAYRAAINAMRQEGAISKGAARQSAADVSGRPSSVPADISAILKKYGH